MVRRLILVAVFFVTLLPCLSIAATDGPYTATISSKLTDWSESPDVTSLAFTKFNPALGILSNVTLDLSGVMNTEISVTNIGDSPSNGEASTHLKIYVKYSGLDLGEPQINMYSNPFEFTNLAVNDTATGTFNNIGFSATKNYTSSAILAAFTGAGNIILDGDTLTGTTVSWTGGNVTGHQITNASLTGIVTYTYIVPEPATIAMLTAGGLALLKRKSRK